MDSHRLRNIRIALNKTQKEVAQSIQCSERNYQRYESGVQQPTSPIIIAIANYFDVSTDYLLGRTDNPNSHKS